MQQREGRIIRQGNENSKVDIYTYVTENTFDSYLYQLVEGKQKFIGQIMTSKSPVRSAEDIDETALSYAEIKALCSGNPHIKEKMDLDIEVQKLKLLRSNHMSQRYALEDQLIRKFPNEIASMHQWINGLEADMALLKDKTQPNADGFCPMVIGGQTYTEKKAAGTALLEACNALTSTDPVPLGSYRGFKLTLCLVCCRESRQYGHSGSESQVPPGGAIAYGLLHPGGHSAGQTAGSAAIIGKTTTALVLKKPKTETSTRKVFLPETVAKMLIERKATVDEEKSLFPLETVWQYLFRLLLCTN